jgi:hypothetical protein
MRLFISAFREHRWLLLFSGLYMAAVSAAALALGATGREFADVIGYFLGASLFMLFFPMLLLLVWLLRAAAAAHDKNPVLWLRGAAAAFDMQAAAFFREGPFWAGVAAVFAILPLNIFFCVGKSLIPRLTAYRWDPALAALDKTLHFGRYPHELLAPPIERLHLESWVSALYVLWFLALFLTQGYCLFADRDPLARMRYLWSTLLCWTVPGTLLAVLFSSVGPAFYADFYPDPSPYADLLPHLRATGADLEILKIGPAMVEMTHNGRIVNLNALSAMPSLHVGLAFLNALYFCKKTMVIAGAAFIYFLVVLAGSVYLGWHYAVDGYAGAALAAAIWALSKPLVLKLHPEMAAPRNGPVTGSR